jgi:hypothetical protein
MSAEAGFVSSGGSRRWTILQGKRSVLCVVGANRDALDRTALQFHVQSKTGDCGPIAVGQTA